MADGFELDVFLTHASEDKADVRWLATALRAAGYSVWLDEEQMAPGTQPDAAIRDAIARCRHIVVWVTAAWLEKSWTQWELSQFAGLRDARRRVIPVLRVPWDEGRLGPYLTRQIAVPEAVDGDELLWLVRCGVEGVGPGARTTWAASGAALAGGQPPPRPRSAGRWVAAVGVCLAVVGALAAWSMQPAPPGACDVADPAFVAALRCELAGDGCTQGRDDGVDRSWAWWGAVDRGESDAMVARACAAVGGEAAAEAVHDGLAAGAAEAVGALRQHVLGRVVATHIRAEPPLMEAVSEAATAGLSAADKACFLAGMAGAPSCAAMDQAEVLALAGRSADAAAGYTSARFPARGGAGVPEDADPLWRCYHVLERDPSRPAGTWTPWGIEVPRPYEWDAPARVVLQLMLDAALSDPAGGGTCWEVVASALSAYKPVYTPEAGGWPGPGQRACGQACAVRYGVLPGDKRWKTLNTDLAWCVERQGTGVAGPDGEPEDAYVLTLPWNHGADGGWVRPEVADVCAFHLVAQGRLNGLAGVDVLAGTDGRQAWAGERGPGVAGGPDGDAVRSAAALVMGERRRATCGAVATQCLASTLLRVIGDPAVRWSAWDEAFYRSLQELQSARREVVSASQPWCGLVRGFLAPSPAEAELDLPCAVGVDTARGPLEAVARAVASEAQHPDGRAFGWE